MCVAKVMKASSLWSFLIIFPKYCTKSGLKIKKWQDEKTKKKRYQENIFALLVEGRLLGKKLKEVSWSIRWCHAVFYILHKLQKLIFTIVLQSSRSENFGKFLETHSWWSAILAFYFIITILLYYVNVILYNTFGQLLLNLRMAHTE